MCRALNNRDPQKSTVQNSFKCWSSISQFLTYSMSFFYERGSVEVCHIWEAKSIPLTRQLFCPKKKKENLNGKCGSAHIPGWNWHWCSPCHFWRCSVRASLCCGQLWKNTITELSSAWSGVQITGSVLTCSDSDSDWASTSATVAKDNVSLTWDNVLISVLLYILLLLSGLGGVGLLCAVLCGLPLQCLIQIQCTYSLLNVFM